ncbi:hypothetical protein [Methanobrevibacter sp.]
MVDVLTFIMAIIVIMIAIPQAIGFVLYTISLLVGECDDDDDKGDK